MPGTRISEAALLAGPPPVPPRRAAGEALGRALRRALQEGPGRVVLRVEEPAPHRRRVARALLQEGALAAGGQVLDGPEGDLLLVGAETGRAERLRALLDRLVGPAGTLTWSLERDAQALLAYAAGQAAAPQPAPDGPPLAALDAALDSLPLAGLVLRRQGLRVTADGLRPAFLRLEPARAEIAARLGPLGADPDLLDHAARRIAARLPGALADPRQARGLLGEARPARLHLPLPSGLGAAGALPPGMLVASLPLPEAAEPGALAARQAALAAAGIGLELDGLDAAALELVEASALPGDLLRLHWSPALRAPGALRGLDPGRLVLAGAPAPEAAAALGIGLVETA
jgi:hypothetical protein